MTKDYLSDAKQNCKTCTISEEFADQLKALQSLMESKSNNLLFMGSMESVIEKTIGSNLFGNISMSGAPSIIDVVSQIKDTLLEKSKEIKRVADLMKNPKDISIITTQDLDGVLKLLTKRCGSKLEWLVNTTKYVEDNLTAVKGCLSKTNVARGSSTGDPTSVLNNYSSIKDNLKELGVENPDYGVGVIGTSSAYQADSSVLNVLLSSSGS